MTWKTRARAREAASLAENGASGLGEAWLVWALLALDALAVFTTYARLGSDELYHTSIEGIAGGASRAIVVLNFPVALVAIALAGFAAGRLTGWARWAAALAVSLCLPVFVPGVVNQDDLDARPVNAIAVAGVLIALGLTLAATRRSGASFASHVRGDRIRIVLAVVLALMALPWIAAELGFYLGGPFMGAEMPRGEEIAAVHLGHHHGFDGTLLALAALALSRLLPSVRGGLHTALGLYLALMLAYGIGNAAQDAWLEQLWKRGWTDWRIPSLLRPELSVAWALLLLGAFAVWTLWFRRLRPAR